MAESKDPQQLALLGGDERRAVEKAKTDSIKRDKESTKRVRSQRTKKDMDDAGAFVEQFIANGDIRKFPVRDQDVADENREREPRPNVWMLFTEEIDRAFKTNNRPPAVTASFYANMLLRSRDAKYKCELVELPPPGVMPDRILAHVQAAPIKLDPHVASSVARRACLILLNKERLISAAPVTEPVVAAPAVIAPSAVEMEMCMDCGSECAIGEPHTCPSTTAQVAAPAKRPLWRQEPKPDPPPKPPEVLQRDVIGYVRNKVDAEFYQSGGIGKEGQYFTMPAGLILEMVEPLASERLEQQASERDKKTQLIVVRWRDKARLLVARSVERVGPEEWNRQERKRNASRETNDSSGGAGRGAGARSTV